MSIDHQIALQLMAEFTRRDAPIPRLVRDEEKRLRVRCIEETGTCDCAGTRYEKGGIFE